MNKTVHRRSNRGDEKNSSLTNAGKGKSNERTKQRKPSEVDGKRHLGTNRGYKHEDSAPPKREEVIKRSSKSRDKASVETKQTRHVHAEGDTLKDHGKINKFVFHEDDTVALKLLHYTLDINESLLTLSDPKKPANKRNYYILSAKDIFYEQVKEPEAFQLKVKKTDKEMVSDLVLKGKNPIEKQLWLDEFGIKMNSAGELLKACIDEVENRRFCKGQKKRNEVKELKEVDIGTLLRALDNHKARKLKLSNDKRWNVSRIEKLIQVLLSEIPQPLVPYPLQDMLDKPDSKSLQKQYPRILKKLPNDNHKMLNVLIEHLENLTSYYTNQLNASTNETEKIRRNICSRLTPLIIRQEIVKETDIANSQNSTPNDSIVDKFCNMFYKLMETTDVKKHN